MTLLETGQDMFAFMARLFPICRSITGEGVRQTLQIIADEVPLQIRSVTSGSQVFDWTVPKEWNIREAYIEGPSGARIVDFKQNNLHVVSYSVPVRATMSLQELRPHLHADEANPDWIPYRTSYYKEDWGFCLPFSLLNTLTDGDYHVVIDASLEPGELNWGEVYVEGESDEEIVISTHVCHPSLANDNLSGIAVCVALARYLAAQPRQRLAVRFLFLPGTIGSIVWLAGNRDNLQRIKHGIVAVNLGDGGPMTFKRSRNETCELNRVVESVLSDLGRHHKIRDFSPYGYDERQFCSPGINLDFGCLSRTAYGEFPEYHTSADNLDFISVDALQESLETYTLIIDRLNRNGRFINRQPMCEPQLGKRGLYDAIGGQSDAKAKQLALLWVLNYSDGDHDLVDIARRANLPFLTIAAAADALRGHALLAPAGRHE